MSKKNKTDKRLLSFEQTACFCRDCAMLLRSGIALHDGVSAMLEGVSDNTPYFEALAAVEQRLAEGGRLSQGMRDAKSFPDYACNMAEIGEASGRLDNSLSGLAEYYEEMSSFSARLKNAVVYPVILIAMMTAVVAVLIWAVLPVLAQVLSQFDGAAAATTKTVMNASTIVCGVLLALLALALAGAAVVFVLSKTRSGSEALERFVYNSPLTRKTAVGVVSANFLLAMSGMLKSGLATQQAARMFAQTVKSDAAKKAILGIADDIDAGKLQEKAFADSGLFSAMDCRLIRVACKSGALDEAMEKLAQQYRTQSSQHLESIASTAEPALVAVLSVIIGAIMLSAMLPLIQIMSSIG